MVGCARGSVPFPYIELREDANEVCLLHGTSIANAAILVVDASGYVCGGVGARPALPWPSSSARRTVVSWWVSLWAARGTVRGGMKWSGLGVTLCCPPSHRRLL